MATDTRVKMPEKLEVFAEFNVRDAESQRLVAACGGYSDNQRVSQTHEENMAIAAELARRWNAHKTLVEVARGVEAYARDEMDSLSLALKVREALSLIDKE